MSHDKRCLGYQCHTRERCRHFALPVERDFWQPQFTGDQCPYFETRNENLPVTEQEDEAWDYITSKAGCAE